jgi:hypothetical protein
LVGKPIFFSPCGILLVENIPQSIYLRLIASSISFLGLNCSKFRFKGLLIPPNGLQCHISGSRMDFFAVSTPFKIIAFLI